MSDDSSVDSDSGIRFKTDSTRNKKEDSNRNKNSPSPDRRHFDRKPNFGRRSHSRDRWRRRISPRRRDRRSPQRRLTSSRNDRSSPRRHSRSSPRGSSVQSPKRGSRHSPKRDGERNSRTFSRRENQSSPRRDYLNSSIKHRDDDSKIDKKASSCLLNERRSASRDRRDLSKNRRANVSSSQEESQQSSRSQRKDSPKQSQSIKKSHSPNGFDEKSTKRYSSQSTDENKNHKRNRDRSTSAENLSHLKINSRRSPDINNSKKQRISPITSSKKEDMSLRANDNSMKSLNSSSNSSKNEKTQDLRNKLRSGSQDSKSSNKERKRNVNDHFVEEDSDSDVQPTSYYNLITVDEVDDSQPETIELDDSSEDEKVLRDKLLILEKELRKTREKRKLKHKEKKHKRNTKKRHSADDEVQQKSDEIHASSAVVKISKSKQPDEKLNENKSPEENLIPESEESSPNNDESLEIHSKTNADECREEGEIISDREEAGDDNKDVADLRSVLLSRSVVSNSSDTKDSALDKSLVAGPALPPHLKRKFESKSPNKEIERPELPPHLKKRLGDCSSVVGPALPDDMREILAKKFSPESSKSDHSGSGSESDGIGPLPEDSKHKWSKAHRNLEERALRMKIGALENSQSAGTEAVTREEWMLELPEAKAQQLGLGPRQFRTKEAPDLTDRSSWTDTPKEKALKAAGVVLDKETTSSDIIKQEAQKKFISERDQQQESAVKKHKKKHNRGESLLEQHQKKLKKRKKKEEKDAGGKVRRPFDRNIDLGVNRFDEAQKKSIIKKAQLLDGRFSSGESKFL